MSKPMVVVSTQVGKDENERYLLPGFEWVTPAVSVGIVTNPFSGTTILDERLTGIDFTGYMNTNEVKILGRGMDNSETLLHDGSSI